MLSRSSRICSKDRDRQSTGLFLPLQRSVPAAPGAPACPQRPPSGFHYAAAAGRGPGARVRLRPQLQADEA